MNYIEHAISEIECVLIGNKSRDVEEVYLNNALRSLKEYNAKNEQCKFCDGGEVLNDVAESNFTIAIDKDEDGYYIETEFGQEDIYSDVATYINYCPMCGKKLEQEEA
ncbi:hypothetical protein ACJQ40_002966 [Enterococcus faecium]